MELLWKKEVAGDSFVDIFENVQDDGHSGMFDQLRQLLNKKDNKLSSNYRQEGNVQYQNKNVLEAMALYNKSLSFAEIGTENVSLAYGNRSACFFKLQLYAKCLTDIELAKGANYPDRLFPKLLKRHGQCLKFMETPYHPKTFVPTLSYDADTKYTGMANVLQIECNEKYGRHITAKSDIEVGKIVLIEEAFVQIMSKMETRCVLCSKKAMNFIACDNCVGAMFCHDACGINYHTMECTIGDSYYIDGKQLIVRSIFIALTTFQSIEELMKFVEDAVAADSKEIPKMLCDKKSKYRAFLKLNVVKSLNNSEFLRTAKEFFRRISSLTAIKRVFETPQKQRFLMHLISHHYGAIKTNLFQSQGIDGNSQFLLFIVHSYFNHSCASNVIFSVYQNQTICTTARPIKAGEQLFVSYSDVHVAEAKEIRQKYFSETYGFKCECDKCEYVSSPLLSRLIYMDPNYKHVVDELERDPNKLKDHGNRDGLKKICIKLLDKSGNLWNEEIEYISCVFRAICSIEEVNLNSIISD